MTVAASPEVGTSSGLAGLLPEPDLTEIDTVDLALPVDAAWPLVRHVDLASSALVRGLFQIRTVPDRLAGRDRRPLALRIDELRSSPERPGFGVLCDITRQEVVVGAIGQVWKLQIPFVHVGGPESFAAFAEPGYVKVAWALRLVPLSAQVTRVVLELRVQATDPDSRRKFRRYFRLIGPFSRRLRRILLRSLERRHGESPDRPLPGDELLPDVLGQATHAATLRAGAEEVWPWLVQLGCSRAGFYSIDALDNGGRRSAREVHPELQDVRVGDLLPARPSGDDGFEVLRLEPGRLLVLGGLYDPRAGGQLPFGPRGRPSSGR